MPLKISSLLLLVLPLAVVSQGRAGEYSPVSVGVQVDVGRVNTTWVPFQSRAGNIQGAEAETMYGLGISTHLRLGELVAQRLSSLVVIPSLDFRVGRASDQQALANFSWYGADGSLTQVQNAQAQRVTNNQYLALSLPVRWYPTSSSAYGGFYMEAGPVVAQVRQTVDLTVDGLVLAIPTTLKESSKITNQASGFVGGIGLTRVYARTQASCGINYMALSKANSDGKDHSALRFYVQWSF